MWQTLIVGKLKTQQQNKTTKKHNKIKQSKIRLKFHDGHKPVLFQR